jgi:membrane-associated protease RseP (regulator of RpoE activity)
MDEDKSQGLFPAVKPPYFFEKKRVWLNIGLFILTILSTFVVGLDWSASYLFADRSSEQVKALMAAGILKDPKVIFLSLIYAAVLIVILLGHELGHYLTCRYYRISATLPYFIPAPTLIGTMGAFIKIKSPISKKQQLFDLGVAGPLAGFILALPALTVGLAMSKVVLAIPRAEALFFGEPLILKFIGSLFFRNIGPGYDIVLHPVAFAGWVGVLVTALNLFPVGQLDGGHVSYAVFGPKFKIPARVFLVLSIIMSIFFWVGWLVWGLLILVLGLKHPRVLDESTPLGTVRIMIGLVVFLIFIVSFIPAPLKGYDLISLIKVYWP